MTPIKDGQFDALYPLKMRKISGTQWTPVAVAEKAIEFLVQHPHTKVLDLGSGAGKFCIVAALCSKAKITGVEQRENLVLLSRKLALMNNVENVDFIHADIKDMNLRDYDAFYFFNSFEEKLNSKDKIDSHDQYDPDQYDHYSLLLKDKLDATPLGTRLVTYCGEGGIVPDSFTLLKNTNKGKLFFWEKRN